MSLSKGGGGGQFGAEIYTAVRQDTAATGGVTEDVIRLEAREDRRIVGFLFGKNDAAGFVEVSHSSGSTLSNNSGDEDRSGSIATFGGSGGDALIFPRDQWIEWSENAEIHLHTRNNTGAGIEYHLTIYYVEERDC